MKYGLSIPNGGVDDIRVFGEIARLAEDAGWDGLFLEDYIVYHSSPLTYDPWVLLGVMAQATEEIRLGIQVIPVARRRPWKLAREAVTVDHLSNGRLILGFGLGDVSDPSFSNFEEVLDPQQRAKMLDEALEVLIGFWSGEPFSYQGEYYRIETVTFVPKPIQKPRIPIWIGGRWDVKGPANRAKRWDGFCPYYLDEKFTQHDVQSMRAFFENEGLSKSAFDISVGGHRRSEDWEQERELIQSFDEAGATWWTEWIPPGDSDTFKEYAIREPLRS